MEVNNRDLAKYIDHTILKADATKEEILRVCKEAKEYGFKSVCVNSYWVPLVFDELKGSDVLTCCVVGFPLGATTTVSKSFETSDAVKNGAQEIDMVINIGALKDNEDNVVLEDIKAVVNASENALVKVIIETCYLTKEEKIRACKLSIEAGADFVKTSTGFGIGGALKEDIKLMRETVGSKPGVKASGGVRTREDALKMIDAGATRIGASSGIKILEGGNDEGVRSSY